MIKISACIIMAEQQQHKILNRHNKTTTKRKTRINKAIKDNHY